MICVIIYTMNDILIYKKSKNRVIAHEICYFIFICAWNMLTYYVLSLDFFSNSVFAYTYVGIGLAQTLIFGVAFGLLLTGKKWSRIIYWVAFAGNLALFYIPIKALLNNLAQFMTYGACLGLMFIEMLILFKVGLYFYQNPYCRIFYDHIVSEELEEKFAAQARERKLTLQETAVTNMAGRQLQETVEEQEIVEEQEQPEPLTYPQLALRLGICVYGELVVFPILCAVFSNYFASYNLQEVFALKDMFMLCIFSAFIWTIPVFYLYYDQPRSKMIAWICIAIEILIMIWTGFRLYGYFDSGTYPLRAILLFAAFDLVRYIVLFVFVKPVLTNEHVPAQIHLP